MLPLSNDILIKLYILLLIRNGVFFDLYISLSIPYDVLLEKKMVLLLARVHCLDDTYRCRSSRVFWYTATTAVSSCCGSTVVNEQNLGCCYGEAFASRLVLYRTNACQSQKNNVWAFFFLPQSVSCLDGVRAVTIGSIVLRSRGS